MQEEKRFPLPPFNEERAKKKVKILENEWNSKDPKKIAMTFSTDIQWRMSNYFLKSREEMLRFLEKKYTQELEYKLCKELWAYTDNRIAVRFAYEWYDESLGQWWRSFGNENLEFDENGLIKVCFISIENFIIYPNERQLIWEGDARPNDFPELSEIEGIDKIEEEKKLLLPSFNEKSAKQRVRVAENERNNKEPKKIAMAYSTDCQWRGFDGDGCINGRDKIAKFLEENYTHEFEPRFCYELWAFSNNRIAVHLVYEWYDESGQWWRSFGDENWEFNEYGLINICFVAIYDVAIKESDRKLTWDGAVRPDDFSGLREMGL